MKRILLLHFAGPPGIGGVEKTIAHHAHQLAALGYQVTVASGAGENFDPRVATFVDPLLGSRDPQVLRAKAELDVGEPGVAYVSLRSHVAHVLNTLVADCDVLIAHNIHTLHKNLALTAALHAHATCARAPRMIAWCNDLAWVNPQYARELHTGQPWNLLRTVWPNTRYVAISATRQAELAQLLEINPASIVVVPPGVDMAKHLAWTPTVVALFDKLQLQKADALLLLPARITPRKNIEFALAVLACLRTQSGRDVRLLVTGPPGAHNPENGHYLAALLRSCAQLGLTDAAHFCFSHGENGAALLLDDASVAALYRSCDALLFPSTHEGFGMPVIEAGLSGLPAFVADLPPLRESGQDDVHYFDPTKTSPEQIATTLWGVLANSPRYRLCMRVRQHYTWDALVREHIVPMIEGD